MNGVVGPAPAAVLHDIFAVIQRLLPVAVSRAVRLPHSLLLPVSVQPEHISLGKHKAALRSGAVV